MSDDLEMITGRMREAVGDDAGIGKTLKFVFPDTGVVYVDGTGVPNTVTNEDRDADCTITVSMSDFKAIVSGQMDPTMAFMSGKLKVAGDMGLAMKLQPLLAKARA